MISEVARSSANVSNGAVTRWANFFHGIFLLLAVFLGVSFIEMIPNAALAAMLIFVGFKLSHPKEFIQMWNLGKTQFVIFVSTIIMTLATDLLIGVGFGILLKFIFTLIYGASFKSLFKTNVEIIIAEDNYEITIFESLVFSNLLGFKKHLNAIPNGKYVLIDVSKAKIADHTSIIALNGFVSDYKDNGGQIEVIGFENHKQLGHAPTSARVIKRA